MPLLRQRFLSSLMPAKNMPTRVLVHERWVLVGASASHLVFLKKWAMHPLPGIELILINTDSIITYTGSLSKYLSRSILNKDSISIDLFQFCTKHGIIFYEDRVLAVDSGKKHLKLALFPPIAYDWLMISTGMNGCLPASLEKFPNPISAYPCRPLALFWEKLESRIMGGEKILPIAVLGSGMTAFELSLNLARGLSLFYAYSQKKQTSKILLMLNGQELLSNYPSLRLWGQGLLNQQGVMLIAEKINSSEGSVIRLESGKDLAVEALVVAGGWKGNLIPGLEKAEYKGFYAIDAYSRAKGYENIFITSSASFRPKEPLSGVKSVRQGQNLFSNMLRVKAGKALKAYKPNPTPLSIINTADGKALVLKKDLKFHWGLWLKNWIDGRYLRSFDVPAMVMAGQGYISTTPIAGKRLSKSADPLVFCMGCGAKVSGVALQQSLFTNKTNFPLEDAAEIDVHGHPILASVDLYQIYLSDPFTMAQILTNHAMNDLLVKHGRGLFAQSIVVLPQIRKKFHAELLQHSLAGFTSALKNYTTPLVGGHSAMGEEFYLGLDVVGERVGEPWLKNQIKAGDCFVLTKPLGVGVMVKSLMAGLVNSEYYKEVLSSQLMSHQPCVDLLQAFGIKAATDVSGFGLLGHLAEMLRYSGQSASLELDALPCYAGSLQFSAQGQKSSLWADNLAYSQYLCPISYNGQAITDDFLASLPVEKAARFNLVFDPQTSGPWLAAVPEKQAPTLVQALRNAGFPAATIGQALENKNAVSKIQLY